MKRGIFLSIILGLCLDYLHSAGHGAKTKPHGKVAQVSERQRRRQMARRTAKSWMMRRKTYYSEELALLDVLHQLME